MLSGGRTGERLREDAVDFLMLVLRDELPALTCARFALRSDINDLSEVSLWRGGSLLVSEGCSSCTSADSRDGSPIAGTATLTFRNGPSCIQAFSFRNVVSDDQPDVSLSRCVR